MAHEPVPSLDLGHEHLDGLNVVGTVALPSHPAGARIFVVRYPGPKKGSERFFIKIVQRFGDCHVVTHFVELQHVRHVRFHAPHGAAAAGQPSSLHGDDLKAEVSKIEWSKFIKDDRHLHEVELRPNHSGTVLVGEASPVILRTEASVPAATSLGPPAFPGSHGCPTAIGACPRSH
jgi:hypothetical protein